MYDLIVVGAGPSGLSCAIEAANAGLSVLVLEKGSLVDYIRRFPTNLVWFSTPELLEIGGIPFTVSTARPTRIDVLNYYQRVVRYYNLDIRYHDAVEDIVKKGSEFVVTTSKRRVHRSRNVVVSTGYFDYPNHLNVPGEHLPNVCHYYVEPFDYFGCNVVVVGGRNSAVEAALDLFRHGVRVSLVHRGESLSEGVKYWILPDIENRIKAGEIQAFFGSTVKEIQEEEVVLETPKGRVTLKSDFVFVLIGFRPDVNHLRRFSVFIDDATLVPFHDSNTLETNVSGLFVAGSVVAGANNNKVFVENGRLHGRAIVATILATRKLGSIG
jgi:thioredoxin reductase (NADPH)